MGATSLKGELRGLTRLCCLEENFLLSEISLLYLFSTRRVLLRIFEDDDMNLARSFLNLFRENENFSVSRKLKKHVRKHPRKNFERD